MLAGGAAASCEISSRGVVEQSLLVIPLGDLARVCLQLPLLESIQPFPVIAPSVAADCQRQRSQYASSATEVRARRWLVNDGAHSEARIELRLISAAAHAAGTVLLLSLNDRSRRAQIHVEAHGEAVMRQFQGLPVHGAE